MAPVYSAMPWKMLRNAAAQGIGITEYAQQNMREMVAPVSYTHLFDAMHKV